VLVIQSVGANEHYLSAAADDDKLLCEESVGEVWLSCVLSCRQSDEMIVRRSSQSTMRKKSNCEMME